MEPGLDLTHMSLAHKTQERKREAANRNGGKPLRGIDAEARLRRMLRTSADRLCDAQEIAHLGFWELNFDTGEGSISEEVVRMLGLHPVRDTFTYEKYLTHVAPNDLPQVKKIVGGAFSARKPFEIEHCIVREKDGDLRTVFVVGKIIKNREGRPVRFRGIIQDITKQHKIREEFAEYAQALEGIVGERTSALETAATILEQEKARAEAILEDIGDGMIFTNKKGVIELANRRAADLLGRKQEELIGHPQYETIEMQDEEGIALSWPERPMFAVLTGGKRVSTDPSMPVRYYVRKDKSRFPVAFTNTPVFLHGELIGAIEVFRDVTRGKAVDRAKSEFVSLASHQLRTPLSIISMYAELLKRMDVTNFAWEDQRLYVNEIGEAVGRMAELINNFLNVSRIDTQTLSVEIEEVDIGKIAEQVLKELAPKVKAKKLSLETDYAKRLSLLSTDKQLIQIVLQNLLSNAIKYTPPKGKIGLAIARRPDTIIITVTDTGCGISEHQQTEIFKKLFRADNVKAIESEGTGLGLYIAKSIVLRLGGEISFESRENKGTVFRVELPTGEKQIRERERERDEKHKLQ